MEALIIGLEHNYRGADLEVQLGGFGVPFKRVPGVMVEALPGALTDYVDQAAARILQRRELTKGEIGCALAHRNAWAEILAGGEQFALVFEDDARLTAAPLDEDVQRVLASDKPAVVLLDAYSDYTVVSARSRPVGNVYRTLVPAPGAWAYALNRAAAAILLEDGEPVSSVCDWPAKVAHKVRFYVTYPQRAYADEFVNSNLEEKRHAKETERPESSIEKLARMALVVSHARFLRSHRTYGSYSAYAHHELRRLAVNQLSRSRRKRLVPQDQRSPLTIP